MNSFDFDVTKPPDERKSQGPSFPDWVAALKNFQNSNDWAAARQLMNTFVPYCCCWYLMVRSIQLGYSYGVTLVLALPAAAFLVRLFILFHDCVHDTLFKSTKVNSFFGTLIGILVFTPFGDWRFSHFQHHDTYANLDSRGFGDIWTLTLKEYKALPKKHQLMYRFYRNPAVMFGLGALFMFLLRNRIPLGDVKRKEKMSILFTNLLIIIVFLVASHFIGWKTYLLIQLPVLWLAGMAGIWLFYVQHQFTGGYWARTDDWDGLRAAMEGSSFYKLPGLLRWFSSNIGYHHVHHLNSRIPNYNLTRCYDAIPALQAKAPLTLLKSFSCVQVKLWDEDRQEMVPFP